ncbi:MAG: 16S rRNA (cytidine(1402)-2'-O)-methyltransferase [Candidatus Cloacimonas sp.]|nr:16S rRNA (cytidine(1402)-2'-O)-methyltransferase [Candidatus Cloacimonas sp.]
MIYLVPVPIGNLGDITLRALETLKQAELIACEDTRKTAFLLSQYKIPVPKLISFHKFNERQRESLLFAHLNQEKDLVVVSDAGSPGISDPCESLVQAAIAANIEVIALPGASALIPAISCSGFSTRQFQFIGFLPSEAHKRQEALRELSLYPYPSVIYEAPHRITAILEELLSYCGNRKICLCREISKLHEEHLHGDLQSFVDEQDITLKGEFAIVLEGCENLSTMIGEFKEADINYHIHLCLKRGLGTRESSQEIASIFNLTRSQAYELVLNYLKKSKRS